MYIHLRELFYCRHPGDARVKVGSDRQAASSRNRLNFGVGQIVSNHIGLCAGGPSKIAPASGE